MKLAGKAFVAGFAGWMGAATAIGVTAVAVGFVVRKAAKQLVTELESELKARTDDLLKE